MTDRPSTVECINRLLERVPEIRDMYDEHIQDNDEILPHVFLGDVTRFVVQQVRSGETGTLNHVARILDIFEQYMASGDDHVKELISVSFVENLAGHEDALAILKKLVGPNLENEFKSQSR